MPELNKRETTTLRLFAGEERDNPHACIFCQAFGTRCVARLSNCALLSPRLPVIRGGAHELEELIQEQWPPGTKQNSLQSRLADAVPSFSSAPGETAVALQ